MERDWRFIADYEQDPPELEKSELRALSAVWQEQKDLLQNQEALGRFTEKLKREWAIETGLIERLYVFDRGITEILIERGIDAAFLPYGTVKNPELVVSMINDHRRTVDGLFDFVKQDRELSTSYIKELHASLTRNQISVEVRDQFGRLFETPLHRGEYKRLPNNPARPDGSIHQYCPPEHVAAEMDRLIEWHRTHQHAMPEVESAWLHHRFAQIHPFQDGNGRVARALATLVFLREGWFPLVVKDSDRDRYIGALEAADDGRLGPLVAFFAALQKEQFVHALGLARDVLEENRAEEVIARTSKELQRRRDALKQEWESAKDKAQLLRELAKSRLQDIAVTLKREIQPVKWGDFFVDQASDQDSRSHYFRNQITETAKEFDYYANTSSYRAWVRLVLKTDSQGEILISFHGIGYEFRGILAVTATWFQRVETEEREREVASIKALSEDVFQINYKEEMGLIQERFRSWLEETIVTGLKIWQNTVL